MRSELRIVLAAVAFGLAGTALLHLCSCSPAAQKAESQAAGAAQSCVQCAQGLAPVVSSILAARAAHDGGGAWTHVDAGLSEGGAADAAARTP
jgi:hypothetical protein